MRVCRDSRGSVVAMAEKILHHAHVHRTKDDVTVMVLKVWPASEWDSRRPDHDFFAASEEQQQARNAAGEPPSLKLPSVQ